jgi:hypothetical protein
MAVHGDGSQERRWSNLADDILSDIYLRSVSAYDGARFAAVCSSWRAAVAWHPRLPTLPLLLLSTGDGERDRQARAYSPEDGRALRVPLPWFPWGNRLVGSYEGGWIAAVSGSDGLLVVNIFSGVRAARLDIDMFFIRKIVFSEDPLSGGCVCAAMTFGCTVALHRVGCPNPWWTRTTVNTFRSLPLLDIAFCNGELVGVTYEELLVFHIGVNEEGALGGILVFRVDVDMRSFYTMELSSTLKYVFELHGKLAIAVEVEPRGFNRQKGGFYRVFELADNGTTRSHKYAWVEVTSLGDHALFLGPTNCKAEHISTVPRRGGVERNRIYYSKQHPYFHNIECLATLDIGSCTVHCWESESKHHLERIVSHGYHYRKDQNDVNCSNGCVWLWPPNF